MNVLFVCTSNKDRSPALEKHFREKYPKHQYSSSGINQYLCSVHGGRYLNQANINWADLVVYAHDVHHEKSSQRFIFGPTQAFIVLNCGTFNPKFPEEYINKAEEKLKPLL